MLFHIQIFLFNNKCSISVSGMAHRHNKYVVVGLRKKPIKRKKIQIKHQCSDSRAGFKVDSSLCFRNCWHRRMIRHTFDILFFLYDSVESLFFWFEILNMCLIGDNMQIDPLINHWSIDHQMRALIDERVFHRVSALFYSDYNVMLRLFNACVWIMSMQNCNNI